jgi:aspartate aminotransferase-like enzyme
MRDPITYFVPGPTFVPADALAAMQGEMIGHRSADFRHLYDSIAALLGPVFRTEQPVLLAASSGTLVMELAIASLVPERVLHLVCGGFSERWVDITRSRGLQADTLVVPWGQPADLEALRSTLRSQTYDAVTVTHSETSTGVLNPLSEICAIVHAESDALVLADCVSSLAGAPMEFDAWGIDLALAGVQKALAVPPGLALFAASPRAYERARTVPHRGYYTDLLAYLDQHERSFTITTPPISVMWALLVQLQRIDREGIEQRWERHANLRARTARWAEAAGFTYASADGYGSPTVGCLRSPAGVAPSGLVAGAASHGFTIGGGYGRWKDETIRIGHMGEVTAPDLDRLFGALDTVMSESAGAT